VNFVVKQLKMENNKIEEGKTAAITSYILIIGVLIAM
jgi:hypothetical protein